jgi:hypothetical protein
MLDRPEYSQTSRQAFFGNVTKWYVDGGGIKLGAATDYFQPLDHMFDYLFHDNAKGRIAASRVLAVNSCNAVTCPAEPPP